jgi:hypothetical protein
LPKFDDLDLGRGLRGVLFRHERSTHRACDHGQTDWRRRRRGPEEHAPVKLRSNLPILPNWELTAARQLIDLFDIGNLWVDREDFCNVGLTCAHARVHACAYACARMRTRENIFPILPVLPSGLLKPWLCEAFFEWEDKRRLFLPPTIVPTPKPRGNSPRFNSAPRFVDKPVRNRVENL